MKRYTFTIPLFLLLSITLTACAPRIRKNTSVPKDIVPEVNTPTTDATLLTPEDAESIALTHAGLTTADVTNLYTEYDIDDGIPEYEIQFYVDQSEYDYTIHAETGDILFYDKDMD